MKQEIKINLMRKYLDDMKSNMDKSKTYRNKDGLIIDFDQFAFLVEACIPPRPIARTSFWYDVIEYYYHVLTWEERHRLFEWITSHPNFYATNGDCLLFYRRFDPDNQYMVDTLFEGKEEQYHCFYMGDRYYTSKTTSIQAEYIQKVTKIE